MRRLPESRNSSDTIDHLKRFMRAAGLPASARYQDSMASLPWAARQALYQPAMLKAADDATTVRVMTECFDQGIADTALERALRTDLRNYMMDDILTLSDRLSMWHSLELRVPYVDHHLVELARACLRA